MVATGRLANSMIVVTCSSALSLTAVEVRYDIGGGFSAVDMFDDGVHGDGLAGDDIYGAIIPAQPHGSTVSYYVHTAMGESESVNDPVSVPTTVYRYATPGAGLSCTGLTVFKQQANFPEMTESTAPSSGYPWSWTASAITGFSGSPSLWFEYIDSDHTRVRSHLSNFDDADWEAGVDGSFILTLSNGMDDDIVYTMHLSLRSLAEEGLSIFRNQLEGGTTVGTRGVYGYHVEVDDFNWAGASTPPDIDLEFDIDGYLIKYDLGNGPWNLDGTCQVKLQDGNRPPSFVYDHAIAIYQIIPDTLVIVNDGIGGGLSVMIDGGYELWDWAEFTGGLETSILTGIDVTESRTFEIAWEPGAASLSGETGGMHCAHGGVLPLHRGGHWKRDPRPSI